MSNILVGCLREPWVESSNLPEPKGKQGYAKDEFPFASLDEGSARLLNYIALKGSYHDKAALVKTIFRCTVMGRLLQWRTALEGYRDVWRTFCRAREGLQEWAGRPGTLVHTKGSFFESVQPPPVCDVIYIDPPKVLDRTDIYSGKAYGALNSILEQQKVMLPKWTGPIYLPKIQHVLASTKWKMAILFHASGLIPTLDGMLAGLPVKPTEILEFNHDTRVDYAIVMKR